MSYVWAYSFEGGLVKAVGLGGGMTLRFCQKLISLTLKLNEKSVSTHDLTLRAPSLRSASKEDGFDPKTRETGQPATR